MPTSSSSSSHHPREDDDSYPTPSESHYHAAAPSSPSSSSDSDSDSPPPLQHAFFAPPFYNRPPTPLPPSPSLTSLLRPSRPTTPDSSADELEPVPRASPKVPTYEYYGFVLYLFSSLTFGVYLLWSYLPTPFLHALGIYYYPERWWSLAVPAWIVMLLVWIYVALASYNTGYLTLALGSVETVVDDAANVGTVERMVGGMNGSGSLNGGGGKGGKRGLERRESWGLGGGGNGREWKELWSTGTDAVMDVPLGGVCEVLYGEGREVDVSEEEEEEEEEM